MSAIINAETRFREAHLLKPHFYFPHEASYTSAHMLSCDVDLCGIFSFLSPKEKVDTSIRGEKQELMCGSNTLGNSSPCVMTRFMLTGRNKKLHLAVFRVV